MEPQRRHVDRILSCLIKEGENKTRRHFVFLLTQDTCYAVKYIFQNIQTFILFGTHWKLLKIKKHKVQVESINGPAKSKMLFSTGPNKGVSLRQT